MEFTGNRLELLEMAKKAMKLADDNSPVEMLKGIYLESDEDAGEVSMITANSAAAIFMKEKASVSNSGKIVINAKMLTGMLSLLSDEKVKFSAEKHLVKISSGNCVYSIVYLPGDHYPKPVMPFPGEAVKLSGICSIVKKTVFATAKDKNNPALQCVCLTVKKNSAYAAACDKQRMMLIKGKAESAGAKEFLLPAQPFQTLASISTDEDVFEVGIVGNDAVFTKKNMLFAIKRITNSSFIDTSLIVKSVVPKYTAIAKAVDVRMSLDLLSAGAVTEPVNIRFINDTIQLMRMGETSLSQSEAPAELTGEMPKQGFYYNLSYLLKLFQVLDGTVKFEIDEKGMMLVRSKNEVYFQLPTKPSRRKTEKRAA